MKLKIALCGLCAFCQTWASNIEEYVNEDLLLISISAYRQGTELTARKILENKKDEILSKGLDFENIVKSAQKFLNTMDDIRTEIMAKSRSYIGRFAKDNPLIFTVSDEYKIQTDWKEFETYVRSLDLPYPDKETTDFLYSVYKKAGNPDDLYNPIISEKPTSYGLSFSALSDKVTIEFLMYKYSLNQVPDTNHIIKKYIDKLNFSPAIYKSMYDDLKAHVDSLDGLISTILNAKEKYKEIFENEIIVTMSGERVARKQGLMMDSTFHYWMKKNIDPEYPTPMVVNAIRSVLINACCSNLLKIFP